MVTKSRSSYEKIISSLNSKALQVTNASLNTGFVMKKRIAWTDLMSATATPSRQEILRAQSQIISDAKIPVTIWSIPIFHLYTSNN